MVKVKFLFIFFFILLTLALVFLFQFLYQAEKERFLNHFHQTHETHYEVVYSMQLSLAKQLFQDLVNTPEVIALFEQAHDANSTQQAVIRQQMLEGLQKDYHWVKKSGFYQLHFHLPNNHNREL